MERDFVGQKEKFFFPVGESGVDVRHLGRDTACASGPRSLPRDRLHLDRIRFVVRCLIFS